MQFTGGLVESTLGKTEISITSIQKYNNKDYIDNELFKLAKWYNLYEGIELLETKILAIFFIVKLVSQTKEHIMLKEYQLLPKEDKFRLYMFSIGCRKLDLSTDLTDGYVIIRYYKDDLENKADKTEFFKSTSSINQIRNLNNLDLIGEEYSVISLATSKEFIKNLQILVYAKSDSLEYSATIDLSQIINKSENEVRTNAVNNQKDDSIRKLMKKPEKNILNSDEILPLYYENSEQIGAQKKYIEMYRKTMESFPIDVEEINNEIGEETYFDNYYIEVDKRGKAKEDDDSDGKINRPEVDYPYENDLPENQLDFITSPLQKAGEKKECGLIRYVMKIVRENDPSLCEDVEKKFKETVEFIQETRKKNCIFICRIYLLNVSNLKLSDSSVEDAFVWIKRYHDDREYKDSKRPFKVNTGEVNSTYAIEVVWPDTFFVNIEFYESINSFGIIRENLIGSTEIDLEKRYFHPVYQQKMKNHKKFKQIPIESRTLYGNDGDMAKGAVRMWLEIVPKKKNDSFPITPLIAQNMEKYEMRIVIWNTREVPLVDGKVNIQVKVQMFDGKEEVDQYTDTHNNSKDGIGEFNWRIVIPFWYPSNKTNLNLAIYNDNLIAKDEILGFANIDMRKYYNILHKTKSVLEVPREWIPLEPSPQVQANYDLGGEIELEIKILTWQEAENNKVGKGQSEPNKDPVLERPKNGRNFLDNLSFIGDLIDSVANFAGGYLGMIKFLAVIGTIVGIAYFIMQMVK